MYVFVQSVQFIVNTFSFDTHSSVILHPYEHNEDLYGKLGGGDDIRSVQYDHSLS